MKKWTDDGQRVLPLRHPTRPRAAALSASFAPGAWGPRLRVTRRSDSLSLPLFPDDVE